MTVLSTWLKHVRAALMLGGVALALPISCSQGEGTLYVGGIQPSPASRVNPFEQGIPNDGY